MLRFSNANLKLKKLAKRLQINPATVFSFNLPSGYSCPKADKCLSKSDRVTGKITDGKDIEFRCYAATLEAIYPSMRKMLWNNFDNVKAALKDNYFAKALQASLPEWAAIIRLHASGDFFNDAYFNAWNEVARNNPDIIFYTYSKVLKHVLADRPDNFRIVYSIGGKDDKAFAGSDAAYAKVIYDASQATLPINEDDYEAYMGVSSNLIIHGTQPRAINLQIKDLFGEIAI